MGYFAIPGAGFLLGSKFKKHKKPIYFISAVLSGIKLTCFLINAHRKTVENNRALVSCRAVRDFFSKSLKENQFIDEKRKALLDKMTSKQPI